MKNEIEQTLMRYFSQDGTKINFFGEGKGARKFLDFYHYGNIYIGDAPDMLILKDDEALIIEHFEFDCYRANRKGSQNRKEQFRIKKASDATMPTEEGIAFHDCIRGESSYKNYIQNVHRSFEEHCAHLSMYHEIFKSERLIDDSMKIEVLFLIEDVSPLGSGAIERSGYTAPTVPIVLAQCKEFLDILRDNSEIDYILSCSSMNNEQYLWFIDQSEISVYYEHIKDYGSMQFLDFTPRVSVFKRLVSEEMIRKKNGDI